MKSSNARITAVLALIVMSASPMAAAASDLPYAELFDGPDGSAWPAPWFAGSTHVTVWDLQANRARLNGDPAFVARMILPGFSEVNVEMTATVEFEDVDNQGFGFYVRQNGGTLREYDPWGQGYAMFLKGDWFWPEDLGLWREIDGVETQFAWGENPAAGGLASGTRYRVRYRVTQSDASSTLLQARVWLEGSGEPTGWTVEALDSQAQLQGTPGSFAIDIYNYSGFGHIFIDDLALTALDATGVPVAGVEGDVPAVLDGAPSDAASSARLALLMPRPHPVGEAAIVSLSLPERGAAELSVYDAAGRLVSRRAAGVLGAGASTLDWRPVDLDGRSLASGVYLLRLVSGAQAASRRIVIAR